MMIEKLDKIAVSKNVFNFLEKTALEKIKEEALIWKESENNTTFFLNNTDELKSIYNDIWGEYDRKHALTDGLIFLKATGLYELKAEPKYFIKLPHFNEEESYVNYFELDDEISLSDEEEVFSCQTKFTYEEIENNPLLKEYKKYAVEVVE